MSQRHLRVFSPVQRDWILDLTLISSWVRPAFCSGKEAELIWAKSRFFCWIKSVDNLVRWLCPARFLFFGWRCPKVAHIWSLPLTLSSSCVHHSSTEFPHATGAFKHRFLRKSLSVVCCESVLGDCCEQSRRSKKQMIGLL